jgi:hypothetical protein
MLMKIDLITLNEAASALSMTIQMAESGAYNLAQITHCKEKLDALKCVIVDPSAVIEEAGLTPEELQAREQTEHLSNPLLKGE